LRAYNPILSEASMRTRARVLLLLVATWVATLPAQSTSSLPAAFAELDAYASKEYSQDPVGSLMVGVVADGRLAWSKSYGFADVESKRQATDETLYRVGSITKQFTSLMLLQLVERGKVRLSDPVV
jgi:CubicO group peptidase (beta-lactamase class C family)